MSTPAAMSVAAISTTRSSRRTWKRRRPWPGSCGCATSAASSCSISSTCRARSIAPRCSMNSIARRRDVIPARTKPEEDVMRFLLMLAVIAVAGCATREPAPGGDAAARTVKITPVGSHDGEFCAFDRALIFEDPDGTRILYDVGRTVRGANDARLGKIDGVLLSH